MRLQIKKPDWGMKYTTLFASICLILGGILMYAVGQHHSFTNASVGSLTDTFLLTSCLLIGACSLILGIFLFSDGRKLPEHLTNALTVLEALEPEMLHKVIAQKQKETQRFLSRTAKRTVKSSEVPIAAVEHTALLRENYKKLYDACDALFEGKAWGRDSLRPGPYRGGECY